MSKVFYLNLPKLPNDLSNHLINLCQNIPLQESSRQWLHNFQQGQLTIAGNEYATQNTTIDKEATEKLEEYFTNFFPGKELKFRLGRISNITPGSTSVMPPHCDRKRQTAINYLLKNGGDKVYTCFYKENRMSSDLDFGENKFYKEVTLDSKFKFPEQTWHVYNVQKYHSVENVEGDRFLLSIILGDNPEFEDFCSCYKDLLMPSTAHSITY
jgi:hypothetical protein